jgi:hypothetical protein
LASPRKVGCSGTFSGALGLLHHLDALMCGLRTLQPVSVLGCLGLQLRFLRLAIDLRLLGAAVGFFGIAGSAQALGIAERTGWTLWTTTAWHRPPV